MPLAHESVLAAKLRSQSLMITSGGSSMGGGTLMGRDTTSLDTGLNTMTFQDQIVAHERRVRSRRRRPRTTSASFINGRASTTFGVRGHQEDSHLDRLEKRGRKQPGPADYVKAPLHSIGGKFNLSNAKSDVDWLCYHAARQPGPGAYDIKPPKLHGGKFSTAFPKSDVEWLIYYASTKPGVGQYNLDEAFHKYVGPGPQTQLSSIDRGLYDKPSTFRPKQLPRKITKKQVRVIDDIHRRRKQRRSFGRFAPSDTRRQREDRMESSKTLSSEMSGLRRALSRHINLGASQPQIDGVQNNGSMIEIGSIGTGHSQDNAGGSALGPSDFPSMKIKSGNTMGRRSSTGLSKLPPGSLFRHASASVLLAPPKWDKSGNLSHEETMKGMKENGVDGIQRASKRQGGAGACWAEQSAGLVFVAHDDLAYRPDKSVYKNREIRQVVRVAPLKVPRI